MSLVLLTRATEYVDALTSYRYEGLVDAATSAAGFDQWVDLFLDATSIAVEQAATFAAELTDLRAEWTHRLAAWRVERGIRERPRAGSAVARLIDLLPEVPVLTTYTAQRLLTLSFPAAQAGLDELADAQIVHRKAVERGATGYLADEVFDLLTTAEPRLASTRWDTRRSEPVRPVPARQARRPEI